MTQPSPGGPAAPVPPVLPPLAAGPAGGPVVSPHAPPLVPGDGTFRVDFERAPEVIKELQTALADLQDIRRQAVGLGQVDPTSNDSVSIDAARAFSAVATGGPGSFVAAVDGSIAQLEQLIHALTSDLANYAQGDSGVASTFIDDQTL